MFDQPSHWGSWRRHLRGLCYYFLTLYIFYIWFFSYILFSVNFNKNVITKLRSNNNCIHRLHSLFCWTYLCRILVNILLFEHVTFCCWVPLYVALFHLYMFFITQLFLGAHTKHNRSQCVKDHIVLCLSVWVIFNIKDFFKTFL